MTGTWFLPLGSYPQEGKRKRVDGMGKMVAYFMNRVFAAKIEFFRRYMEIRVGLANDTFYITGVN